MLFTPNTIPFLFIWERQQETQIVVSSFQQQVTHLFRTTHFPLCVGIHSALSSPIQFPIPPKKRFFVAPSQSTLSLLFPAIQPTGYISRQQEGLSLFSPTSPLHPLPIPPPTPPDPVMNQFLQRFLCSLCRQPDSFRGRTDGPDTCCRLVRPRNKSLSWQRRLDQ